MPYRSTQDGQVIREISDKMRSTEEDNGKPLQYSCLENSMNILKMQKDRMLKDELLRSVGAQYALEISGEITPERMKGWSQSKHPLPTTQEKTLHMDITRRSRAKSD